MFVTIDCFKNNWFNGGHLVTCVFDDSWITMTMVPLMFAHYCDDPGFQY